MRDKKYLLIAIALLAVGFILYAPNLKNGLFWDDNDWIVNNVYVHSFSWANLKFIFSHDALAAIGLKSNYYRPFLFFTFMLNYLVGGVKPVIYHLTNNLIHIGNAILIFFLLDKFIKKRLVAILASLLFLIHPLQTEAVTYVAGRGDPLSVFLMLLALTTFLYEYRFCSYLLAILAILSRETAFLFPLYLMVFLIAFIYKDGFLISFKKSLIKALPFFGISFIYGISRLTVFNFQSTLNFYYNLSNAYTQHLSYRIYTFLHALAVYFRLIFIPTGLHMEREILVSTSLFQWPVWLGVLIILLIGINLLVLYKKERADIHLFSNKGRSSKKTAPSESISSFRVWFFAWGFFFVGLTPTSGIFPINALIYEHWLYFSLFGFFTLLAFYLDVVFNFLKSKARPIFYITVVLFSAYLVFLSVQTVRRNIIWGKPDTFYQDIIKYEPTNIRAINNLAMYYVDHNRAKEAEDLYWRAIKLNDIIPAPYYNLGNILRDRKDIAGALELYKKSIEVDPQFSYGYMNIAAIYAQQGNLIEALNYLEKLKAFRSEDALVYFNIARVQNALSKKEEAIQSTKEAIKYSSGQPDINKAAQEFLNSVK